MSTKANGGFPPITYCPDKVNNLDKSVKTRERLFAPITTKNINIRQILKENIQKPVIDLNFNKNEDLDVIDQI
jgi:hypothetical protein